MSDKRVIIFNVPGDVRGQGRPRTQIVSGKDGKSYAHIYQTNKDIDAKHNIQLYAGEAMKKKGYAHLAEPDPRGITIEILCYVKVPSSMSRKKAEMAYRGEIVPMRKPDLDNVMKSVLDALNSVVWKDDKDVTKATICRYYSDRPRLSVRVTWEEEAG